MPNIEVLKAYSGILTQGRIVYPGVYAEDDPTLAEAVEKMIAKGFAIVTEKPIPEPVAATPPAQPALTWVADEDDVIGGEVREEIIVAEPAIDYAAFTTAELKELCEAAGLEVVGTGRSGAFLKSDYVRALEAAEG